MFDPMTATLIVAGLAGGYSAYEANKQTNIQKKAAGQAVEAAQKQEADANALAAQTKSNETQAIMRNQRRSRTGEPGLRDTLITGPMGLSGGNTAQPGQTGGKTLLGL